MPNPPPTMSAVAITTPGGPEVLELSSQPTPKPGQGQVLVKVAAAGVNRPDVAQRMGLYPPPPGHSPLPGLEIAGEVVEAGAGATRWKPGDRVCALVNGGGYAEYCIAEGGDPKTVTAGELAQGKPVTIGADDDIREALRMMQDHQVRRLPVIDGHDLIGIIAQADVARELSASETAETVEQISVP